MMKIYKLTSSMFPSEDPKVRSKACNLRTTKPASFDVLISGSVTISIRPVPDRFKSIKVVPGLTSCILFPVSYKKG